MPFIVRFAIGNDPPGGAAPWRQILLLLFSWRNSRI